MTEIGDRSEVKQPQVHCASNVPTSKDQKLKIKDQISYEIIEKGEEFCVCE